MEKSNEVTKDSKATHSWMRQNVIDVGPTLGRNLSNLLLPTFASA